jgi:hypothetical protein
MSDPTQENCPSSPNLFEGLLTLEQLAAALGKSTRTLLRWQTLRTGPPCIRLGKTPLFRAESVREWLSSMEQQPRRKSSGPKPFRSRKIRTRKNDDDAQ